MSKTSFPFSWASLSALQAGISVAAGAFGAHALTSLLDERELGWWHTGSQYLMYHALASLLVCSFFAYLPFYKGILRFFFLGNLFFAGSLYCMTLTGYLWLGAVTPVGGVCYLLGWLVLSVSFWKSRCP